MTGDVGTPLLWAGFTVFILGLLALDLGLLNRRATEPTFGRALTWSVAWILLALAFNAWIHVRFGPRVGMEFLTGYLIEKALSVDNVFVFLVIFNTFAVPASLQYRVLFWGVLGAIVMRAIFIGVGAAALHAFHGVIYLFGGILLLTGIKLLLSQDKEEHPERNPLFRLFQKLVRTSPRYEGGRFFTRMDGRRVATPLFAVLVLIEITDLVFAVDSIPAIFAITDDPFIVFTSNIFAILGLRALYFCVSGFVARLRFLKVGLALVLIFVAAKMLLSDVYKVPIQASLVVVAGLLAAATIASLVVPPKSPSPSAPRARPEPE